MILGVDCSTYLEEIEHGAKYYNGDIEIDPVEALRNNGVSVVRLRLWADPYSPNGVKYLAGTCDLNCFIKTAKLFLSKGYRIMLDIHYSDFWADPGKQFIPKSWKERDVEAMSLRVYSYTCEVLKRIADEEIPLAYIQIGNEITNGMLWPIGKLTENVDGTRGNYDSLIRLLNAGIRACRELTPSTELVIHLERSHDQAVYNEFFDQMIKSNVDFDIIGMSYYPYWHGNFEQFFANVENCKKYRKKIMAVELGYAFTLEDYIQENGVGGIQLVINDDNAGELDIVSRYPISRDGQAKFVHDYLVLAADHGLDGVFWWEPLWIPGDGICWASPEAKDYIQETHKPSCRNEWANQCLFDYDGKMLPSFNEYKI